MEIIKEKGSLAGIDPEELIKEGSGLFDDADKNTLDGIKFPWDDTWVHLRQSNAEPIMRIVAEAPNKDSAKKLVKRVQSCI